MKKVIVKVQIEGEFEVSEMCSQEGLEEIIEEAKHDMIKDFKSWYGTDVKKIELSMIVESEDAE